MSSEAEVRPETIYFKPSWRAETIIPFAPAPTSTTSGNADQLDRAGQTILQLLNRAASVAEQNSRNAIEMAQALSHKLRAAEAAGDMPTLYHDASPYSQTAVLAKTLTFLLVLRTST